MKRVVLTGGGTGGHVYPLIAVGEAVRKMGISRKEDIELHYVGFVGEYRTAFEQKGIIVHPIVAGKLRRYISLLNIIDIPKFFIGLLQAWVKMYFIMPDAIFSKGGTGALPVLMAGWFYHIPIVIHESDSIPGLNNLFGGRLAKRVAVSFEGALKYFHPTKGVVTGSPLRRELIEHQSQQARAKEALGFDAEKPLVLVLGGSQGSQRINELIVVSLPQLVQTAQVLHQTGKEHIMEIEKLSRAALLDTPVSQGHVPFRYQPVAYLEGSAMADALSAADLVVSRSGSNIFEFAAFGKPAILIPIEESANGHQQANAYAFSEHGGGIVIEESNLLPNIFITQIRTILDHPETQERMKTASRAFFLPNAGERLAEEILALTA